MSFRSAELAIQPKTKSRLRMAVKLYPTATCDYDQGVSGLDAAERKMSPDELGDSIINEVIKAKYPLVIECEREIAKIEREMMTRGKIKTDGTKPPPTEPASLKSSEPSAEPDA